MRFLVHFVGDIAQPLHAEDNGDRSGNQVRVIVGRRHTNLHAVWDVDVVRALGLGRQQDDVAARLEAEITPAERKAWSAATPAAWANESHQIAHRDIYARFPGQGGTEADFVLPPAYARQESIVAAQPPFQERN